MATKKELLANTKEELIKLAKSAYGVLAKATETKDAIVEKILGAEKAAKTAKKAPAKKAAVARKPVAKAAKAAPMPAPKAPAKTNGKKPAARAIEKVQTPSAPRRKEPAYQPPVTGEPAVRAEKMHVRDEETVEDSKYFVASTQAHLESANIPDAYGDNRIMLFVRDPFWTYSAWDLHPETPAKTAQSHGLNLHEFNIALRVYDVTDVVFTGTNANRFFDIEVGMAKGNWYVNVPEDDRNYLVEVGLKNMRGDFYMMARSNVVSVPRNGVSSRMDEEWMIADEDFWRMYALSGGFQTRGAASMEFSEEMRKHLAGETSSGFVSSFGSMRPKREQDQFWFRLDCELIVYGATEPDANVTLLGQPVKLRPDGTFTARFSLPDGMQVLEATAVSANRKFEKTITPTVSRSTTVFQNRELYEEKES
ncbi:MAG: DUF4912 domain-containing protein [Nitrospinae bacterium]|nr:DUF4912 domain-containing protein [Nitrospinota bacterium]